MTAPAYMRFYVADYIADTMHLTRDQHGAYVLLICAYWRNSGPLPDDNSILAMIAKASPGEWQKLRRAMLPFFHIKQGHWRHKRIDAELKEAKNRHDAYSQAGSLGAARRWLGHRPGNGISASKPDSEFVPFVPDGTAVSHHPPFVPLKGDVSPPRSKGGKRRRNGPLTTLFEGAMNAADAISDREEAAQAQHRSPGDPPPRPLLDRR